MKNVEEIRVGLGERSYPIRIGTGLLPEIGPDLAARSVASRYVVVSDDHVAGLYGQTVLDSLADAGLQADLLTFARGEGSKNLGTIGRLASRLAGMRVDRTGGLIALGGGVTGDITGFLAAVYMRGIPFVQVPTTLLAQVDSSVGGKTGVDIPEGKNLVGSFHQPRAVYIDLDVLTSLPDVEMLGGLAEVIKYGVIRAPEFFEFLEKNRERILERDPGVLVPLISRCCAIKAEVVEEDEREGGVRRILNFGHTIGHAVEAASDFSLIHGLAVAIGMRAAAELAVLEGLCSRQTADRLSRLLTAYGFATDIPPAMDRQKIRSFLMSDKKAVAGRVFFVLPREIGQVVITDQVRESHLDAVLGHGS